MSGGREVRRRGEGHRRKINAPPRLSRGVARAAPASELPGDEAVTSPTRRCRTCRREFPATRGRRYCSETCWPSRLSRYAPRDGVTETGSPVGDSDELNRLLWAAARRGSVAAMVNLRRELKAEQRVDVAPSVIEELANRRRS